MTTAEVCAELAPLQRQRAELIASRVMLENRLVAVVSTRLGYRANLPDAERQKKRAEAKSLIDAVTAGADNEIAGLVAGTRRGSDAYLAEQTKVEKAMRKLALRLSAAAWVAEPEQNGFGILSLAVVVGECGDLSNYSGPAKVWKRMGCAPWTFDGETRMGATWMAGRGGKLPASEWEAFGYCPRRRSIAYLIGENIVRGNKLGQTGRGDGSSETGTSSVTPGPYRDCYDAAKERAKLTHPDWTPKHCHLHAMLLATKAILRDLWAVWNGRPTGERYARELWDQSRRGDPECVIDYRSASPA